MELIPTEYQEQKSLLEWCSYHPHIYPYLVHITNEVKCNPLTGKRLNDIGRKKGVSDLFLAIPTKQYHGLWIEMKRRVKAKVTVEQHEWLDRMNSIGYQAIVAYGWEEAKEAIESYLQSASLN